MPTNLHLNGIFNYFPNRHSASESFDNQCRQGHVGGACAVVWGVCPAAGPGSASLAGGVAKALLRHYKVNIVDAFRFSLCQ